MILLQSVTLKVGTLLLLDRKVIFVKIAQMNFSNSRIIHELISLIIGFCHVYGPIIGFCHVYGLESTISIGYHMNGEVISVLSLEERYYNCHEGARDSYDIVTRVIQLISPSQSCDNLFITYLCFKQGKHWNAFFIRLLLSGTVYQQQKINLKSNDKFNSFPCCFTIPIFFQRIQTHYTEYNVQTLCPPS